MSYLFKSYLILSICLLAGLASAGNTITGGWDVTGNGASSMSGSSYSYSSAGDPSATMGITASSNLFGVGSTSDQRTGTNEVTINLGGFNLTVGFDGSVSSSLVLSSLGTSSVSSYVGSTATGQSTGNGSYEVYGSSDLFTDGYLNGQGSASAHASGSTSYDVLRSGTPSEAYGQVSGLSSLSLSGLYSSSMSSTGGVKNGLHAESGAKKAVDGTITSSSSAGISSKSATVNGAKAEASASGFSRSGAWDATMTGTKAKIDNEMSRSSVLGKTFSESKTLGINDAATAIAALESSAFKDNSSLTVSGGPATYATGSQNSNSAATLTGASVTGSYWGSMAMTNNAGIVAVQWGHLSNLTSGVRIYQPGVDALTFGKISQSGLYQIHGSSVYSEGNTSLDTLAEGTRGKNAFAGTLLGPTGSGTLATSDGYMQNTADFTGGLDHYSHIDSNNTTATTSNILGSANATALPNGNSGAVQYYTVNSGINPMIAWSRTVLSFSQAH